MWTRSASSPVSQSPRLRRLAMEVRGRRPIISSTLRAILRDGRRTVAATSSRSMSPGARPVRREARAGPVAAGRAGGAADGGGHVVAVDVTRREADAQVGQGRGDAGAAEELGADRPV